jgi:transposase InsO family protein
MTANIDKNGKSAHRRWAEFRFGVVGGLLSAPPDKGTLAAELKRLAEQQWRHPISGELRKFGKSTIERWYGAAVANERKSPVDILRRKVREDAGTHPGLTEEVRAAIRLQHDRYPYWSYKLHYDNLVASFKDGSRKPSYATVKRFMKATGRTRRRRPRRRDDGSVTPGAQLAASSFEKREIRSYEREHVGALWHLDFHHCSRKVLIEEGRWVTPIALGILDDHSRLICHLQWYLAEGAENLCHGVMQAIMRRGLPRELMTDNGSAMGSDEFLNGLLRLGVTHDPTLPYSPHQNGKQESFWGRLEGRFVAMLDRCRELTLKKLNDMTFAWIEHEYNVVLHDETGETPAGRYAKAKSVMRSSPGLDELRGAFRCEEARTQRRSDGSVSIEGRRFEVPARYRHLRDVRVRYAEWDLGFVTLMDPRSGADLCRLYPQDKAKNASGIRKSVEPLDSGIAPSEPDGPAPELPPLLEKLLKQQRESGLPPAYIPKTNEQKNPDTAIAASTCSTNDE